MRIFPGSNATQLLGLYYSDQSDKISAPGNTSQGTETVTSMVSGKKGGMQKRDSDKEAAGMATTITARIMARMATKVSKERP